MNRPDVYYGEIAANYEAARSVKSKWKIEQAALADFLSEGPVLDVPFGTGRFVPIYRAKGLSFYGVDISADMLAQARRKFPDVNAELGSVFDLDVADGEYKTAVCVRFLEWLPLPRATLIIDRLRRAADTIILTIVHGTEGQPEAYTYDHGKFLQAIDGLMIENRRVTAHVREMISEMFKLRPAVWSDVVARFALDYGAAAADNIQRIGDKHAGFFGLPPVPITEDSVDVRAEYWDGGKIGICVEALAGHRFITDARPRFADGPLVAIERDGIALIIDGRKRANLWMGQPGPHPVLVMRPHG